MSVLAVSISHKTAPVSVLERVSMDAQAQSSLAAKLVELDGISEAMVLSTCNRTEVYVVAERFHAGIEAVAAPLATQAGVPTPELAEICEVVWDQAAVHHAFNLAAGLDSLVIGENQILGQVRQSLGRAQREGTANRQLNTLFQNALRVGKRVHAETEIGQAGRSILSAALEQLDDLNIDTHNRRVLVIGAGQMAGLAARTMADRGADLICVNRTFAKAERLAQLTGGRSARLSEVSELAGWAELIITCTGASRDLLGHLEQNAAKPTAIVDLAMPADVDPSVRQLGITLVNLETLMTSDAEAETETSEHVRAARGLVDAEVAAHLVRERSETVTPTVVALRSMAEQVVAVESARLAKKIKVDDETLAELTKSLNRVADKLLHAPTVSVRQLATAPESTDYADALRRLFQLDSEVLHRELAEHCDTQAALAMRSVTTEDTP